MASSEKVQKYKNLLRNLLPPGRLWDVKNMQKLAQLLEALANEFCRVDDRVQDLIRESDPSQTIELLEDWERALGLPDECTPEAADEIERRTQLLQKLTNIGGISAEFYEFLILQLGFEATVTNPLPFRVGKSVVGDALTNDFEVPFTVGMTVGEPLLNVGWLYYFNVEIPATAAEVFEVGDTVGTPLREFSNPLIECTIRRLKPAHAGVTFTFIE